MKIIILVIVAVSLTVVKSNDDTSKSSRFFADAVIRQIFELLRHFIKEGSISNDVPVSDPLQILIQVINIVDDKFRIQAKLSNITLSGLGDFELVDTTFDKDHITLELNFRFPLLTIISEHYELIGDIYGFIPLFGNGLLNIEAHDLKFWSKIHLKQSDDGKSILIGNFLSTQFAIDKIVSRTEFDGSIDDIMNVMIEDLLADYLTRFSKFIAEHHKEYATKFFNQYFTHFESWRLIAVIL